VLSDGSPPPAPTDRICLKDGARLGSPAGLLGASGRPCLCLGGGGRRAEDELATPTIPSDCRRPPSPTLPVLMSATCRLRENCCGSLPALSRANARPRCSSLLAASASEPVLSDRTRSLPDDSLPARLACDGGRCSRLSVESSREFREDELPNLPSRAPPRPLGPTYSLEPAIRIEPRRLPSSAAYTKRHAVAEVTSDNNTKWGLMGMVRCRGVQLTTHAEVLHFSYNLQVLDCASPISDLFAANNYFHRSLSHVGGISNVAVRI